MPQKQKYGGKREIDNKQRKLLCLQRLTHRDKSDAALRRLRASGRMANHRGVFHSLQGKCWYDNNWIVYL